MTDTPTRLVLRSDDIELELLDAGAAVRRLVLRDTDGTTTDAVLGHADPLTYVTGGGYLGASVGRVPNRIDGGRFTLDGREYTVPGNDRGNALHGGPAGFDTRRWTVEDASDTSVTFSLVSPDGDQGFPGELTAHATYALDGPVVTIRYSATATAPTVAGLTNHAYFDLDGGSTGGVLDHTLEVAASAYTPTRPDLVPTGEVAPVDGTPFDLRSPRRLRDVLAEPCEQLEHGEGLDHNLVLDGTGMRRAARLVGATGRTLEVHTDRPGLQVYTGAHFDGSATGLSGRPLLRNAGVALETQGFPDAPNHPHFPCSVLRPGEELVTTTTWHFTSTGAHR
ncbi:galactose mutarotase [Phycicoccus sp. CSK15P-2]|uniref:aldose epimerase family protein n=1 Tax=Phycicoccus sp. CSK15P-2 TaxID=2807627 RepID=UPI00195197CD|nr:aldose epimerase family protein [Phycicoccus sp. CSK15P-2]MBM6403211.1 galactose mutarotase [Phycicoccus sp. CSK15P-2]